MKIILHTEFDIFTYKAAGVTAGLLVYALLAFRFPQFDLLVVTLIAFIIGSLVWFLLSFIVINRNGLCIEFRYSKSRLGFASVTLSKGFKQLDYMEFELPAHRGVHNLELDDQIDNKLMHFLKRHLSDISEFEVIHFVGCTRKDANQIGKLFTN